MCARKVFEFHTSIAHLSRFTVGKLILAHSCCCFVLIRCAWETNKFDFQTKWMFDCGWSIFYYIHFIWFCCRPKLAVHFISNVCNWLFNESKKKKERIHCQTNTEIIIFFLASCLLFFFFIHLSFSIKIILRALHRAPSINRLQWNRHISLIVHYKMSYTHWLYNVSVFFMPCAERRKNTRRKKKNKIITTTVNYKAMRKRK